MNKYGISEAKSTVGFKTYAVPSAVAKATRSLRGLLVKGAVFVSAFSLVVSAFTPVYAAPKVGNPAPGDEEIIICHAGNSDTNPYQVNSPSKSSVITDPHGHDTHNGPVWNPTLKDQKIDWGDIIPPFSYTDDEGTHTYDGKNWNTDGQALYNNEGCDGSLPNCDNDPQSFPPDCDTLPNSISITKVVTGANAPTDWTFGFTASGGFNSSNPFNLTDENPTLSNSDLDTGAYVITENAVSAPWSFVNIDCGQSAAVDIDGQEVTITLEGGDDVECTFTNNYTEIPDDSGTIIVKKETNPDGDQTVFNFDASGGTYADFTLSDGGMNSQTLAVGTYSVSEGPALNWDLTDATCVSSLGENEVETIANLELDKNETITCTFFNTYNEDQPQCQEPTILDRVAALLVSEDVRQCAISGYKYSDTNDSGVIDEGDAALEDWTIFLDENNDCILDQGEQSTTTDSNGYYQFTGLGAGSYTVCEVVGDGWTQVLPGGDGDHDVVLILNEVTNQNFLNAQNEPDPCVDGVDVTIASSTSTQFVGSTTELPIDLSDASEYPDGTSGNTFVVSNGAYATIPSVDWVSFDSVNPPAGGDVWYLYSHTFNIPAGATAISGATLEYSADNRVTVFFDDVEIDSSLVDNTYSSIHSVALPTLTVGTHTLKFAVQNIAWESENPTGVTYKTSFNYIPDCDDGGGDDGGGDGGGGGSRRNNDDNGRVLGDSTGLPYQPQVLGETTELPRTGTPISIAFSLFGLLAIIMIPKFVQIKR